MTTYSVINKDTGEVLYLGDRYSHARQIAIDSLANGLSIQIIEEWQGKYENEFCVEIFNDKEILTDF